MAKHFANLRYQLQRQGMGLEVTISGQCTDMKLIADATTLLYADRNTYARGLREVLLAKRQQLDALEAALANYESSCASEETARANVKAPVSMPWA